MQLKQSPSDPSNHCGRDLESTMGQGALRAWSADRIWRKELNEAQDMSTDMSETNPHLNYICGRYEK